MNNPFENQNDSFEQEVIEALDSRGIEDSETKELLQKFVDECHSDSEKEAPSGQDVPDNSTCRANIKAEVRIAMLYTKTERYKEEGINSLYDIFGDASQNEATADLAEEIRNLIRQFE